MALNPGDKVKYLNATGGGIVTRVLDSRTVLVSDEDGFEIPTLISELVRIEPMDAGGRFFDEPFSLPREKQPVASSGNDEPTGSEPDYLDQQLVRSRKAEEILLAFVPHDQKWLITGPVDVILVNNTSWDVLYNLFQISPSGGYTGKDYGSVFAGTRQVLATVSRDDLSAWAAGSVQFLFHREQAIRLIPPYNADFEIDGTKFHKEGAYKGSVYLSDKSIMARLLNLPSHKPELETRSGSAASSPESPSTPGTGELPLIFKHQKSYREAEVDLHIHELVDDPSNLQKNEILEFQKTYILRCLHDAMVYKFLKVTFIHGIGNGVLRNVLIDILEKSEGIEYFDAPMSDYGVGALEVRIPHNLDLPAYR